MGDIYYEGKEYEARVENLKPGQLSERLKEALGMGENTPPPWLINMQRYGPPPSYPDLKVPGLNAPIPPGGGSGREHDGEGVKCSGIHVLGCLHCLVCQEPSHTVNQELLMHALPACFCLNARFVWLAVCFLSPPS